MLLLKSTTSDRSVDSAPTSEDAGSYLRSPKTTFTFIAHKGFQAQILAYMLDSLVRVSRRVNENRIVSITNEQVKRTERDTAKTEELCSATKDESLRYEKTEWTFNPQSPTAGRAVKPSPAPEIDADPKNASNKT